MFRRGASFSSSSLSSILLCGCHRSKLVRNLDIQSNQDIIDARPFIKARKEYNLPPLHDYFLVFCPFLKRVPRPAEFGAELGRFRDIPAYSSYYESADPDKYPDDWCYMSYYDPKDQSILNGRQQKFVSPSEVQNSEKIACEPASAANFLDAAAATSERQDSFMSSSMMCPSTTTKQQGVYLGHKFQCVQGARFFLLKAYGLTFDDVGMAHEIFDMKVFYRLVVSSKENGAHKLEPVPVLTVGNANSGYRGNLPSAEELAKNDESKEDYDLIISKSRLHEMPLPGCVLIWAHRGFFKYTGHIAIVTEVVKKNKTETVVVTQTCPSDETKKLQREVECDYGVRVWEQNFDDESWQGRDYSRELPAFFDEEKGRLEIIERIHDSKVKGWMATRCMLQDEMKRRE